MRTLSESLRGNGTVTNRERLVNESQQQEINSLVNEVEEIHGDIDALNDRLDEPVLNKDAANITGRVNAGSVHATDGEFIGLTAGSVGATSIDATSVDADEIDVGRLESTTTVTTNATITNATISNADITDANITNFSVDNFTSNEITSEDIMVDDIVVNNTLSADVANVPTVNATDIDAVTIDATTVNGTTVNATDLDATYGEIRTLDNHILENEFLKHDDFYIDVNQVVSDTNFIVIELPNIKSGDYRLTYYNSQMTDILFSFTLNDTKENKWFSYSRALDQKSFDEVAIKDGKLYIKTWYTGRLYFHSDTLDNIVAPKTYGEWPIDTEDLDYPLFSATRIKATVYTHFVNIGMDSQEYGTAVFSYNTTHNWQLVKDQLDNANPIEYDPQTDVLAYNYIPDQNVNVDSDVEFGDVEADNVKVNGTVGHTGLEISNIENGQILRKRSTDTQLTAESPVDVDTDDQPLSRLSDGILTERTVANWNGATNRPYIPGADRSSFTAVFSERDINDPEDYGTKSATSVNNVYKLTSNGNETYYKEIPNAQVSDELEPNDSIVKADFDDFIANTPANYSYHLDAEVDEVKFYTLMNTSTGTVAFAYDDGLNVYGTNYVGQSTDSVFESLGLSKSTDYESLVSSEWDTSDFVVDIVYVASAYDYLDKYWGVNNVFPKGTGQNIDGELVSSTATATGATFYYNEAEYIGTSHNYVGPTAQNCTIDANGNVSPNQYTRDAWNYRRNFIELGPNTGDSYTIGNSFSYMPNDSSPSQGYLDMPDSLFTNPNTPAGVIDDSGYAYSDGNGNTGIYVNGYVMYHDAASGTVRAYDNSGNLIFTNNFTNSHPQCKLNNYYRSGFISSNEDASAITDGKDYPLTVNEVGQTVSYVYYLTDGAGNYKYVHTNTRNDAVYSARDWNWEGWTSTNDLNDVLPTTWSYTQQLQVTTDLKLVGYIEQADTDIKFTGKVVRQVKIRTDRYYDDSYLVTVRDWAVYWTAALDKEYFQDDGAIGNKYILLHNGDSIPNPLRNGRTYHGGRIDIGDYDKLVMFKIKPVSVTTSTLDYDLLERVIVPTQNQYSSSITHVGKIVEGEWDAGQVKADGDITSTGNLSIAGNAEIGGDLNVAGTITTVHSEEITTEENTIELRHDAQVGLIGNETSGIVINNYDGNNNDAGILLDSSGTLRIGDIGDTEPVATRAESANLTNDNLLKWDADGNRLVDSGKSLDDIEDDIAAARNNVSEINGWSEYLDRINPASAPTNIVQIATQIQNYMTALDYDCIVFRALMTAAQCSTYLGLTFSGPKILVYTCDKSSGSTLNAATLSAIDDYLFFDRYDFTNNVWTPANRINDLNLMSEGTVTDSGTSYGALNVGPLTGASHIEMGRDSSYSNVMRIFSKTANNASVAPLVLGGDPVWVPYALRIPTGRPSDLQPGSIWVSI